MKDLVLIPARGGSKGIPGKNIKSLNGKPLIYYTLDAACAVASPENICVSTDSDDIIRVVREYGLDVPFKRPYNLSTDTASSYDVILHAIAFYEQNGIKYDRVILLQPTSPFRTGTHIRDSLALFKSELDMVVSVKITHSNPYFTLFEETIEGFLVPSKPGNFTRRQDCPIVYEYNGAIYIMNVRSLKNGPPGNFSKIKKYLMADEVSLDIDNNFDWIIAEAILFKNKHLKENSEDNSSI
jgi:CMP-N,N'-diacetyllegionaminic acid synthase